MKSLMIAAMIAGGAPAWAQECFSGSPEPLGVASWTASAAEATFGQAARMRIVVTNNLDVSLRMVQARVFFHDVLGRSIVNIAVDDDASIPAGGEFVQSGTYQSYNDGGISRLVTAAPDDIVATVCTEGAVTETGEVVRY